MKYQNYLNITKDNIKYYDIKKTLIECDNCLTEYKIILTDELLENQNIFKTSVTESIDVVDNVSELLYNDAFKCVKKLKQYKDLCITGDFKITSLYFICPICGEKIKIKDDYKVTATIFDGDFFTDYDLSNIDAYEMKENIPLYSDNPNIKIYYIDKETYKRYSEHNDKVID